MTSPPPGLWKDHLPDSVLYCSPLNKNFSFSNDLSRQRESLLAVFGCIFVPLSDLASFACFSCPQVRIAVFSQHHVDGLDLSSNPLLYMMRCYPVSHCCLDNLIFSESVSSFMVSLLYIRSSLQLRPLFF